MKNSHPFCSFCHAIENSKDNCFTQKNTHALPPRKQNVIKMSYKISSANKEKCFLSYQTTSSGERLYGKR
jgi:hypothetical protein